MGLALNPGGKLSITGYSEGVSRIFDCISELISEPFGGPVAWISAHVRFTIYGYLQSPSSGIAEYFDILPNWLG